MTDPDHRRSQARGNRHSTPSLSPLPSQPNFGAAQASGSEISVATEPSVSDDPFRVLSTVTSGVDYQFLARNNIPQVQLPSDGQYTSMHSESFGQLATGMSSVNYIPQVQLSNNWNAPLRNPIPVVPPAPVPYRGRGRPPTGPLHALSGNQANPAWNNLHRGHIAYREQRALYEHWREEQAKQQRLNAEMLRQEQTTREELHQRETAQHIRHLQSVADDLAMEQRRHQDRIRQETEQQQQLMAERQRQTEAELQRQLELERQAAQRQLELDAEHAANELRRQEAVQQELR